MLFHDVFLVLFHVFQNQTLWKQQKKRMTFFLTRSYNILLENDEKTFSIHSDTLMILALKTLSLPLSLSSSFTLSVWNFWNCSQSRSRLYDHFSWFLCDFLFFLFFFSPNFSSVIFFATIFCFKFQFLKKFFFFLIIFLKRMSWKSNLKMMKIEKDGERRGKCFLFLCFSLRLVSFLVNGRFLECFDMLEKHAIFFEREREREREREKTKKEINGNK